MILSDGSADSKVRLPLQAEGGESSYGFSRVFAIFCLFLVFFFPFVFSLNIYMFLFFVFFLNGPFAFVFWGFPLFFFCDFCCSFSRDSRVVFVLRDDLASHAASEGP